MTGKISVQKMSKSWSYFVQDYDEKYGGTFWLLVVPLMGYDNEVFFYVYKDKENIYIEGESYIIDNKESVNKSRKEEREYFKGKKLYHYILDDNKEIIEKRFIKII